MEAGGVEGLETRTGLNFFLLVLLLFLFFSIVVSKSFVTCVLELQIQVWKTRQHKREDFLWTWGHFQNKCAEFPSITCFFCFCFLFQHEAAGKRCFSSWGESSGRKRSVWLFIIIKRQINGSGLWTENHIVDYWIGVDPVWRKTLWKLALISKFWINLTNKQFNTDDLKKKIKT